MGLSKCGGHETMPRSGCDVTRGVFTLQPLADVDLRGYSALQTFLCHPRSALLEQGGSVEDEKCPLEPVREIGSPQVYPAIVACFWVSTIEASLLWIASGGRGEVRWRTVVRWCRSEAWEGGRVGWRGVWQWNGKRLAHSCPARLIGANDPCASHESRVGSPGIPAGLQRSRQNLS